jgi:hypothetical protein
VVSNGSYKDNVGTSGFVLWGANRHLALIGDNVVPGNPKEQSSYRSELSGISGVLAILGAVCHKYDIHKGSIRLALDGEQALLKASSTWPLSPTDTDFDFLCDIRAKIAKLPINLTWQGRIKGHQDNAPFMNLAVSPRTMSAPTTLPKLASTDVLNPDGVLAHSNLATKAGPYISKGSKFQNSTINTFMIPCGPSRASAIGLTNTTSLSPLWWRWTGTHAATLFAASRLHVDVIL